MSRKYGSPLAQRSTPASEPVSGSAAATGALSPVSARTAAMKILTSCSLRPIWTLVGAPRNPSSTGAGRRWREFVTNPYGYAGLPYAGVQRAPLAPGVLPVVIWTLIFGWL